MPRGGARQGAPGVNYPQRTDMQTNRAPTVQPIKTVPAKNYGDATRDRNAQRAVPLPQQPTPLMAPTAAPNEPITAGMAQGPGAGPEAIQAPMGLSHDDNLEATLRGLLQASPNSDIERLVAELSARRQP